MLRTLWLVGLYVAILGIGATTPFVLTLGYVWVDTFQPQSVAYFILNQLPIAFIMGAAAVGSYFLMDRRSPPPATLPHVIMVLMAIWMTATLFWAEVPDRAWVKWDWAFKAMVFSAFVPLVIRSRVQIEAFAQTWLFSLAANFVPFGLKTLISGGGYGQNLGLQGGNSGLAEGGYLSTVCLMAVPLALYLGKHGQLIPRLPMMRLAYAGVALLAIVTAIGTQERSALIGLVAVGFYMFLRSRRKIAYILVAGAASVAIFAMTAGNFNRAASIGEYQTDGSALTRILVWQWTLDYVASHPLGGSFDAYGINTIVMPPDALNPGGYVQNGRAWHSSYFEILGELGWPGLIMFLLALGSSFYSLIRLSKRCRNSTELAWVADMSDAVQSGMLVFMTSGAFVSLGFQPHLWYFVGMGICLRAYVWHAERAVTAPTSGWRSAADERRNNQGTDRTSGWKPPPLSGIGKETRWRAAARTPGDSR